MHVWDETGSVHLPELYNVQAVWSMFTAPSQSWKNDLCSSESNRQSVYLIAWGYNWALKAAVLETLSYRLTKLYFLPQLLCCDFTAQCIHTGKSPLSYRTIVKTAYYYFSFMRHKAASLSFSFMYKSLSTQCNDFVSKKPCCAILPLWVVKQSVMIKIWKSYVYPLRIAGILSTVPPF